MNIQLQAQNWMPIDTNKIYHFNNDNGDLISKSVSSVQSNDSTFFSTIIEKCDTCTNQDIYYKNQADFLGFFMLNNFDTSFTFYGKDTFTIKTNKQVSDTWNYTSNKTATVINNTIQNFGTQSDSIKTIWLGNFDTLIISKNHGIVQIPYFYKNKDYKQIGIANNYGTQELSFWDIYDFNVGDVFQYIYNNTVDQDSETKYTKYKILSKTTTQNSYKYYVEKQIKQIRAYEYQPYSTSTTNSYDTLIYQANSQLSQNAGDWVDIGMHSINFIYYKYDDNNILTKVFDIPPDFNLISSHISCNTNICFADYGEIKILYKKGLGMTENSEWFLDSGSSTTLIGYYKEIDTIGTIYNDDFYLGIKKQSNINNFINFYPNPTNSKLQIDLKNNQATQIEIYDILGKKVIQETLHQSTTIDVSTFKNGLYIIKACDKNGNCGSSKLIIK